MHWICRILRTMAASAVGVPAWMAAAYASQGPGVGAGSAGTLAQVAGAAIIALMIAVVGFGLFRIATRRFGGRSGTPVG